MNNFLIAQKSWESYPGSKLVANLKKLSKIKALEDVKSASNSLFPGTHCPLMGALLTVKGIKEASLVVVGTDECTFYNKELSVGNGFGGMTGRVYSIVLDDKDVIFGSLEKLEESFEELLAEVKPEVIFLTTTCLIEIIGDDYESSVKHLENRYGIPILLVRTEHLKCDDHFPGVEKAMAACLHLMEKLPQGKAVNILGQCMGNFKATELARVLQAGGVQLGLQLPGEVSLEELKQASAAKLNIVIHDTGITLAEGMKQKFGIQYIYFATTGNPEVTFNNYTEVCEALGIELPEEIIKEYSACKELETRAKDQLQGINYICGSAAFDTFAMNSYLCSLGLKPLLLQTNHFNTRDMEQAKGILPYADPYVCRGANLAPMPTLYKELRPDLFIGMDFGNSLSNSGIAVVSLAVRKSLLGMESCRVMLQKLLEGYEKTKQQREEGRP